MFFKRYGIDENVVSIDRNFGIVHPLQDDVYEALKSSRGISYVYRHMQVFKMALGTPERSFVSIVRVCWHLGETASKALVRKILRLA